MKNIELLQAMGRMPTPQEVRRFALGVPEVEFGSVFGNAQFYTDPEGTIPVEKVGDPIGCVRQFGSLQLVQPDESRRPVWGGHGIGAVIDGDRFLIGATK